MSADVLTIMKEGISETAMRQVRAAFNPSGISQVDKLKIMVAALISELEPMRDARGEAGRCAAIAITHLETAAMYAVKGATSGA